MGQIIHESGKRLERLIENFLIYSQIELMGTDPQRAGRLAEKADSISTKDCRRPRFNTRHRAVSRMADLAMDLSDKPIAISEEYLTKIVDELIHNAFLNFPKAGTAVEVFASLPSTTS